eukprot:403370775
MSSNQNQGIPDVQDPEDTFIEEIQFRQNLIQTQSALQLPPIITANQLLQQHHQNLQNQLRASNQQQISLSSSLVQDDFNQQNPINSLILQNQDQDEFEQYERRSRALSQEYPINPEEDVQMQNQDNEQEDEFSQYNINRNTAPNGEMRESRTRVLARLLRSYYLRMQRGQFLNEGQNEDSDNESPPQRVRAGISRRFEQQGVNSRLERWTALLSNNRPQTGRGLRGDDEPSQNLSIENIFNQRAAGITRRENSLNSHYSQDNCGQNLSKLPLDFEYLKEKLPKIWYEEISSEISNLKIQQLEDFGALTMLLYSRIEKLTKKNSDILELSLLSLQTDGMKFIQKVLNFFTNNIRDAHTNQRNRQRIELLIKVLPSTKQMIKVLQKNDLTDKEKLTFKVVIDIMEIYYSIFDSPLYKKYRVKVIPLALEFYSRITDEELIKINNHIKVQTIFYRQFNQRTNRDQYIGYYEDQELKLNNLLNGSSITDFECL